MVSSQQQQKSTPCDKCKLYSRNSNKYPTQETTTMNISNICCGNGGSSTCISFITYLFARHDYENIFSLCFFFFFFFVIIIKKKKELKTLLVLNGIYIYI